jgi:hypothetical protein
MFKGLRECVSTSSYRYSVVVTSLLISVNEDDESYETPMELGRRTETQMLEASSSLVPVPAGAACATFIEGSLVIFRLPSHG